jgi:predicted DNA binding CopG/RHH family protein
MKKTRKTGGGRGGAARVRVTSTRVPEDVWRQIKIMAAAKGTSVQALINAAISEFLAKERRRN